MTTNLESIREHIRRQVGTHRWKMWFAACADFAVQGDLLHVALVTRRVKAWIETHYRATIEDAAKFAGLRGVRFMSMDEGEADQTLFGEQA